MFKRRILSVVLTAAGLLSAAEWQADVPEKGQVMLRNDSGKFVWGGRHILPMVGSGLRLRKIFPLDKLPAGTLENVRQAKLRVYCNVADFNWGGPNREVGLNEDICVVINGHRMLFKTSDPRFPQKPNKEAPQHYRWVDIPFPAAWLGKSGKLDVTMYKNTGAGGNDYFYVAADTSVPDGSSFVSTDGGRTWSRNFGCIKDGKGEFMLRLILGDSGAQPDGVPGDDFSTDRDITATRLLLQNGAERGEKMIVMPGNASNRILIPGSSGVNLTEYGLTLSAVLRCRAPEKRQDRSMMFFYKPGAFFLGRTGDRFNFSLCADGKSWSQALIGGELPPLGEWFHLAAVVERVDEKAQGNVGYRLLIYLNGELYLQKFLRYVTPDRSAAQVIFGSGLKGYDFCGDVAELSCYNRSMDANEIARIAANAPRVNRLPAGMFEVPADLSGALEKLRAQASSASGRWLIDALKRSASTGADQDKLRRIAALPAARLGITAADAEAMAAAFNAAQPDYRVCVSDEAMILMTLGRNRRAWPVAGMFDRRAGREVFAGKSTEFILSYRTAAGKNGVLTSFAKEFGYEVTPLRTEEGEAWRVTWRNEAFEAVSHMTFLKGRLSADLTVTSLKKGDRLTEIDFPRWQFAGFPGGEDTLVYPRRSGMFAKNPTVGFNYGDKYPGAEVAMQFSAYFDKRGNGVYFGYEEPRGLVKNYSVTSRNGNLNAAWKTAVGSPADGVSPVPPVRSGDAVVELYQGNWFEAAQIYKRFVSARADWRITDRPRKDTPKWYAESAVWFCASYHMSAMKELVYLREYFELPIGVHLAWWYDFKGLNGNEHIPRGDHATMMKMAKDADIRVLGYVNPRLWQFCPGGKGYKDGFWRGSFAEKAAVRSADGSVETENYGIPYPVICPASPEGISQRAEEYARLAAESGLSGLYLDQLACARERACFSKTHGHGFNDPATWVVNGYWKMMEEVIRRSREKNPDFAFDSEDASEVYVNHLDGFMTWRWTTENHLPLFQAVYGGRVQFTGRAQDAHVGTGSGDWESFFQKVAEELVCGEQISQIHLNDIRYASPRRLFAKKMAHLRLVLAPFMNEGDMLAPIRFSPAVKEHVSRWSTGDGIISRIRLPEILSGAWGNPRTGCRLYIFVNPLNRRITVNPVIEPVGGEALFLCREGAQSAVRADGAPASLTLEPYASEIWVAGAPEAAAAEAERLAPTLRRIGGFEGYGRILEHYTDRGRRNALSAVGGAWINAEQASWMRKCYRPAYPTLGRVRERGSGKITSWLQADAEGEVFWGDVDFGTAPAGKIEIMIAADPERAGGTVEFYDVTDSEAGKLVGSAVTPVTGDWFDFGTLTVRLTAPLSGKRAILTRFRGKGCNVRSWRALP